MSPCAHDSTEGAGVKWAPPVPSVAVVPWKQGWGHPRHWPSSRRMLRMQNVSSLAVYPVPARPLYHESMLGGVVVDSCTIVSFAHNGMILSLLAHLAHMRGTPPPTPTKDTNVPHPTLALMFRLSLLCAWAQHCRMGSPAGFSAAARPDGRCLMGWLVRLGAWGDAASRHRGTCELGPLRHASWAQCASTMRPARP